MIVVTGASGFLGSELVKQLLDAGRTIRALKRESSVIPAILKDYNIEWINADILNYFSLEDAFEGADEIYHCAAFISFDPADKKQLQKVNVDGTANVVNLCLQKGVKKLLHVSSVAAIGDSKPGRLLTEKDYWQFDKRRHDYSISKYESEMEVWRGIAEGLNAAIVNPSLIIGKNAGGKGSGQLFETVSKGLRFYTKGSCGLVDVEDVAKSMIRLMESDISAQRFLINAENWSYRDLFTETAKQLSIDPPVTEARPWMMEFAWRSAKLASLFTGKHFSLTKNTARSALKRHEYSNRKIKEAIHIEFKPIKQTIYEICQKLKENRP